MPPVLQIAIWTSMLPALMFVMVVVVGGSLAEALGQAGNIFKFKQGQCVGDGQEEAV